jgi:integrase
MSAIKIAGRGWISKFQYRIPHAWSWNKVKAAAGVNTRWHDLRHFCATQLLELGVSHFDVSIQLGHTDGGALVMERYGHPSVDAAKRRPN